MINTTVSPSPGPILWKSVSSLISSRLHAIPPYTSIVSKLTGVHPNLLKSGDTWSQFESIYSELTPLLNLLQYTEDGDTLSDNIPLLVRRIGWRMRVNNVHDFGSYEALLNQDPAELPALRKSLSMRITEFFRDPRQFVAIEKSVFPALIERADASSGIHMLVTSCGTGEEAYSLAMLYESFKEHLQSSCPLHLVACDSDEGSLKTAQLGYYPHLITIDLSTECLHSFFIATKEGYRVSKKLRSAIQFEPTHPENSSFSTAYDLLVASRTLLLNSEDVQNKLIESFSNQIAPGGFLVLEPSTKPGGLSTYFDTIDANQGLYRRKEHTSFGDSTHLFISPEDIRPSAISHLDEHQHVEAIQHLETELLQTKERLQVTIEEYETSHDELVDSNHVLRSNLEKLVQDRDKAEAECVALKDMTDTILKANHDLKLQNTHYHETNSGLEEIISLCGVGILSLNAELCIEMFTPKIATLFNLSHKDVGRPLSHLTSPFQWSLYESSLQVIRSRIDIEHECSNKNGRWYRIYMKPRIHNDSVEGVVCTFLDITESRRTNEWDRFKASILNRLQEAIVVTNRSQRVTYVNKAAIHRFNLYHKKKIGYPIDELYWPVWKSSEAEQEAQDVLSEKGMWTGDLYHLTSDGRKTRVHVSLYVLEDDTGEEIGRMTVIRDRFEFKDSQSDSLKQIIEDLARRSDVLDEMLAAE